MHRIRRFGFFCVTAIACISLTLVGVYQASKSVPEFYELALVLESDSADSAGDELERQVAVMASEYQQGARWELVLSDQQVNGWLATDLKQKFPNLLPQEIREPRIAFQDQAVAIACQFERGKVSTVLSLQLQAYLTDNPNEIAVRVRRVRAGRLPVPIIKILDQVTQAAHQSGVSLRWSQQDGDPVALVAFPTDRPELRSGVILEHLEVGAGQLVVTGTADEFVDGDAVIADQSPRIAESSDDAANSHR